MLRAAVALADAAGIEAVSMRKLGQELGVEAMSLYHHVANKDDLLDGMVDLVTGEFAVLDRGDWKGALRQSALSSYEVLLSHPWACGLIISRPRIGPARLRCVDALLGRLRAAGFSIQLVHHAIHAIDGHIFGFTLQQLNFPFDAEELGPEVAEIFRRQRADEYPHITEMALGSHHDDRAEFEFVLDLILDGLERARGAA